MVVSVRFQIFILSLTLSANIASYFTHVSYWFIYLNWPESAMTTGTRVRPDSLPTCSIADTTSCPETTFPNTTCFPSNHWQAAVQRKNWEPLVFLPALAIDRIPGAVCFSLKFSSANFSPKMDSPPVPLPLVKSPPWHCKFASWQRKTLCAEIDNHN